MGAPRERERTATRQSPPPTPLSLTLCPKIPFSLPRICCYCPLLRHNTQLYLQSGRQFNPSNYQKEVHQTYPTPAE